MHGIIKKMIVIVSVFFMFPALAPAIQKTGPIKIGVLHSEKYTYAEMMKNSYKMVLEDINKSGGINGRALKLVYGDDQGKPLQGENAVKTLVREHRPAMLIGGYSSSNTLQMAKVADNLDIPLLVSTAADDRITQMDLRNVYRLNPPAKEYTSGLEGFMLQQLKPKTISIVYENSPYGTSGAERMLWFCRKNNIDVKKVIPYHREKTNKKYYARILSPVISSPPDVVYMVSYFKDGSMLVNLLREKGVKSVLVGGAGGFTHPNFAKKTGPAAEKLVTATLWHQKAGYPGAQQYYDRYVKNYGVAPDYHGAEAYTALLVAVDVLKRAKDYTPQSVRDALGKTSFESPMGRVSFFHYEYFKRQNSFSTLVMQIQNGEFQCIWPKATATSDFAPPAP